MFVFFLVLDRWGVFFVGCVFFVCEEEEEEGEGEELLLEEFGFLLLFFFELFVVFMKFRVLFELLGVFVRMKLFCSGDDNLLEFSIKEVCFCELILFRLFLLEVILYFIMVIFFFLVMIECVWFWFLDVINELEVCCVWVMRW